MEATVLNMGYENVQKVAQSFAQQTGITNVLDFKQILIPFGAKINLINPIEIKNNFFVKVFGPSNLEINIPQGLTLDFERFFLSQALGHYLLHSRAGENPCTVSSVSQHETSKEALWFSLELLMPDEKFISSKLYDVEDEKVARLFRVPEPAVKMKKTIVNNFYRKGGSSE